MKKDSSVKFYDLYFSRPDKKVEISMKDGRKILAFITGYYKGKPDSTDTVIMKWHLLEAAENQSESLGDLDENGLIVNHADIDQVRFCSDNTLIKF